MDNNTIKKLKRSLRLKLIFVIAIFLSFNTFAWFIYSSKVENSITAHVRAWRIEFEAGENGNFEYINFDIENIYPGMPNYSNFINIVNQGETIAHITFEITSVRILDEEYNVEEYSQEEILNILQKQSINF